jgi:invasion protein IalB
MIKNSKGLGLVFWIIIIMVVLLVGATFIVYLQVQGQKLMLKGAQVGEQAGIAAHILPKDQYKVVADAVRGELTLTVEDTKGTDNTSDDVYVTDFSTATGYQVYDTGVQTAVNYVNAFPVAYIAVVVDPSSTKTNELLTNLSNLNLANANIKVIRIDSLEQSDFQKPGDLKSIALSGSSANYWGALAAAWQSLPTVPARRDIGPNFLGVVLVSDGRCDAGTDICDNQTLINQALGIAQGNAMVVAAVAGQNAGDEHFYLLAPSCNLPLTKGVNYKQDNLNITLSSYSDLDRAGCYTTVNRLYRDLLSDADTIRVGYEPKFVAVNISAAQYHNITVKVTKRTGTLGAESAYSGTTTVKTSDKY